MPYRRTRGAEGCRGLPLIGYLGSASSDVRSFFDEINQEWLVRFLEHRIGDRRIIRLIQKWLKAGVMEDGVVTVSDRGPHRELGEVTDAARSEHRHR